MKTRRPVAEVDLHVETRESAAEVVHRFINDHWARGWRLRIITGRSDGMRRVVADAAAAYGLVARLDRDNEGVLVVDMDV